MKKHYLLAILLCCISLCTMAQFESNKQVYKSANLKNEISTHKTVAILPFDVAITYRRPPKNFDSSAHQAEERNLAAELQQGMFTFLLRKNDKYTVSFQDVERTNALLKRAGIINQLSEMTQDSVAKLLNVDAVIKCKFTYEKTSSEGAAITKALLFGSAFSKTAGGALIMQIYDAKNGELLWRFYKEMNEDVLGSSSQLMERMMRKVSRNFPYERD
ncbi:DUF4136 domain-containing protein [Foetidibacter luteolus]|uniref:DUF4136 domain-containing protein n=1 Tax=Foetidibacter luteolus TaxID=2608880 RepID=UPI00129B06CE|nr:DUF4136 domain-containing protein [Foetidibacter luteolus]